MTITDKELNDLAYKRQDIIKDMDKGYISEKEYEKRLGEINIKINEKVRLLIEADKTKLKVQQEEKTKMEEEQPKAEVKKPGRALNENSYASVIGRVLQMKSISDLGAAAAKVDELKPGREKAKNVTQIKTVIRLAKAGKGRWGEYTWDAEKFLLVPKEQA